MLWKCFKIRALGHKVSFGAICQAGFAFKALLPTHQAREGLIWCRWLSLCNITQQKTKMHMSHTDSAEQDYRDVVWWGGVTQKLRSLVPLSWSFSSQANSPSASWQPLRMVCSPQTGQCSRFGSTQSLLTPKSTCGYGTSRPDTRELFMNSEMLMHGSHIILLPSFWVTPSLPQTHCPSAFPLYSAPTRPTSREAFLNPFS